MSAVKHLSSKLGSIATSAKKRKGHALVTTNPLKGVSEENWLNAKVTPFQLRVYKLTQSIPRGYVATYGALADVLESSALAVGQALKKNPFAPIVPCHRVIAQGGLGGFFGAVGGDLLVKKLSLLRSEGVSILNEDSTALTFTSSVIDAKCILDGDGLKKKMGEEKQGFEFSKTKSDPAPVSA